MQGIDNKIIEKSMQDNGFKKLVQNSELLNNVWMKVKDINERK